MWDWKGQGAEDMVGLLRWEVRYSGLDVDRGKQNENRGRDQDTR